MTYCVCVDGTECLRGKETPGADESGQKCRYEVVAAKRGNEIFLQWMLSRPTRPLPTIF